MEFMYRDGDNQSTTESTSTPTMRPPTSYPLSTIAYLSEHSLQGGFLGNVPAPTFFRLTAPEYVDEAVWREMEKGRIRRELEKEQIRRELEKEVRIEMELERRMRMGIPIHIPAAPDGVSSGGRMALCLNQRLNPVEHMLTVSQPQLTQMTMAPEEINEPSTESGKGKVTVLAKPDPNYFVAKRKAETPLVSGNEHSLYDSHKKPRGEWSCALCQINAVSEKVLKDHLQGRKHKAKEAASRALEIGMDDRVNIESSQPSITTTDMNQDMVDHVTVGSKSAEQVHKNQGGLGQNVGKSATEKINAPSGEKFKFWCEICEVGTHHESVMESHKNGKKHMKKCRGNNKSNPPTSSVPL